MPPSNPEQEHLRDVLELLERLHRHKDAAYGDAWRKRGEVIAIFANIARKYDRLVVGFGEQRAAAGESLADTVADLCVYAVKYLTWIAHEHPVDIDASGLPIPPAARISYSNGLVAVGEVFAAVLAAPAAPPGGTAQIWNRVQVAFGKLERGLMAQATPTSGSDDVPSYEVKAGLAWTLIQDSAWLLVALDAEDAATLTKLRDEVDRMDRAVRR